MQEQAQETIRVVPYNPMLPGLYTTERALILEATASLFTAFEHIGSTAVPGLSAKPIIDMMAAE